MSPGMLAVEGTGGLTTRGHVDPGRARALASLTFKFKSGMSLSANQPTFRVAF